MAVASQGKEGQAGNDRRAGLLRQEGGDRQAEEESAPVESEGGDGAEEEWDEDLVRVVFADDRARGGRVKQIRSGKAQTDDRRPGATPGQQVEKRSAGRDE